ncbi:hypothetical protein [Leeia sp.]|uniref:hypothetical protein n=1 Tax=Leeia sp. TaxID=2884678 RepID=UPI0035B2BE31
MLKSMRWFAVLMLSMLLLACQKDPIVEDLKAFDALGKEAFGDMQQIQTDMNAKMQAAPTMEGKAAVFHEVIGKFEARIAKLKTFEAKSPEVKAQTDKIIGGFDDMMAGLKTLEGAMKNPAQGQDALNTGMKQVMEGQQKAMGAVGELSKLAKEKGVEWKTQ